MAHVIVVGSGPNGLTAAAYLARAGHDVLVLEAESTPGGAVRTCEVTLPGFKHDLGAGFFPFAPLSPGLVPLDLPGAGLVWRHAPIDLAHPAPNGSCASISRDLETTVRSLGPDGDAWARLARWHERTKERMLDAIFATLPAVGPFLRFGLLNLLRMGSVALASGRGYSSRQFRTEAARRLIPGLCLHVDIGPDDPFGAVVGFVLALFASSGGNGVPEGGAGAITAALLRRIEEHGGRLRTGARVTRILVRGGRAVAVRLADGEEIEARAVIADVAAPTLYLKLLPDAVVPSRVLRSMRRFSPVFGTFKMDWALSGPVPWAHEDATRAASIHTGDSVDDIARFTAEVRAGRVPAHPYLVIGQQSLADPTRAPAGQHTLWAYSRGPSRLEGGWASYRERFADQIEERIEGLAPGFRSRILGRAIFTPEDLFAMNENLIGGDHGGGSAQIHNQFFFRPVFPYFRYRTPVERLYLGSSYTHPGPGVHGACGRNAAIAALADLE